MKRAVLLVGHGSKLAGSNEAMDQVIARLRQQNPEALFQASFLELQSPSIPEGIDFCIQEGAQEVIVVPYFVQTGKHVVQDIPRLVSESQTRHPEKTIRLAEYLGFDDRIVAVVNDRIRNVHQNR